MVQRFEEYFLSETDKPKNLLYSSVTALAILNPSFFDFLKDEKNRYTYPTTSFWQSFILEIKQMKNLKINPLDLLSVKKITIKDNWLELKRCIKGANNIRKKHFNINRINVSKSLTIISDTERVIYHNNDSDINQKDIEKMLGVDIESIYTGTEWNELLKELIYLIKEYLKPEYLNVLSTFLDDMFENQIVLSWETYNNYKLNGLGKKLEDLPKLYYSKFSDFIDDVIYHKNAFRDYQLFIDIWKEKKKNMLYNNIITNMINDSKHIRDKKYKRFITKHFNLSESDFYCFDNKMNIKHIPNKKVLNKNNSKITTENIFINENNCLVLQLNNGLLNISVTINTVGLSLSKIKLKYEKNKQ